MAWECTNSRNEHVREERRHRQARRYQDHLQGQRVAGDTSNRKDYLLGSEGKDELQCGCCSGLVYKPVLVIPCQHFFCGR